MTNDESCRIARAANSTKLAHPLNVQRRFWTKVKLGELNECWEWHGSKTPKGYGAITTGDKWKQAHRVAFEEAFGTIPDGLCVCHRCDNPPCVNPNHLFLGTRKDNTIDASQKGRLGKARGEKVGGAVLTEANVLQMREDRKSGMTQEALAKKYNVCNGSVHNVLARKTWKHI